MTDPAPDGTGTGGGLRHRLRYRFDNLLARGTWAALLWLGAVTLGVVLLSTMLLVAFDVTFAGSSDGSWLEDFWQSMLRVLDPGTMAADVGWGRRLLALLVTLFGLLVAGTLIGIIAAGVEDRITEMRRGRSVVIERDHIVVLGSAERLPVVVEQLVMANAERGGTTIVAMTDGDPVEVARAVDRAVPDRHGTKVVYRSGDPTLPDDLGIVSLATARSAMVLSASGEEAPAVKTVLAVGDALGGFDRIRIVVDLLRTTTAMRLVGACGGSVHPIVTAQAVSRVAGYVLRERGLAAVIGELFDVRGSDILAIDADAVQQAASAAGERRTFGDVVTAFANIRPIGIIRAGAVQLVPPPETQFAAGDRIVAIGDAPVAIAPSTRRSAERVANSDLAAIDHVVVDPIEEHLLVLGWNETATDLLTSWADGAASTSTVEIRYEPGIDGSPEPPDLGPIDVRLVGDAGADPTDLAGPDISTIVVLAAPTLDRQGADARTLLTLRSLQRAHDDRAGDAARPRLVAQLLDVDSAPLANLTGIDDGIISQAIGSQFLAQLVDEPARRPVLLALYHDEGASLHLVPSGDLGVTGLATAGDVYDAAYRRGAVAIGWRTAAARGSTLVINPAEGTRAELDADDQVVVLIAHHA